jgi:hypothetical protein
VVSGLLVVFACFLAKKAAGCIYMSTPFFIGTNESQDVQCQASCWPPAVYSAKEAALYNGLVRVCARAQWRCCVAKSGTAVPEERHGAIPTVAKKSCTPSRGSKRERRQAGTNLVLFQPRVLVAQRRLAGRHEVRPQRVVDGQACRHLSVVFVVCGVAFVFLNPCIELAEVFMVTGR